MFSTGNCLCIHFFQEIQRLQDENARLKEYMRLAESSALGIGKEKSKLSKDLEKLKRELGLLDMVRLIEIIIFHSVLYCKAKKHLWLGFPYLPYFTEAKIAYSTQFY
jgi:hypothetical protein